MLDDVTLRLEPGVTVLMGRNGAGKSTLCRIAAGVESADVGGARRPGGNGTLRDHLRDTGWLPQTFAVPGSMTVDQYVAYAAWLKECAGGRRAVRAALDAVGLADLGGRRLRTLSGGMVRRVGIAQAVAHEPTFLVLDEPTVGLDPEQRESFHRIIRGLAADRIVLLSTHLIEDVDAVADRVAILEDGRLLFHDDLSVLRRRGSTVRAAFLEVIRDA